MSILGSYQISCIIAMDSISSHIIISSRDKSGPPFQQTPQVATYTQSPPKAMQKKLSSHLTVPVPI